MKTSPFFGIPAHTTSIPAQIAVKFDLEIFPVYLERKNDNSFYMEIQDPIKIDRTKNIEEDKKNITIKINQRIEKIAASIDSESSEEESPAGPGE